MLLTGRGEFEDARRWLEQGLAHGADTPRLRDRLVRVLLDLDRPADALAHVEALKKVEPASESAAELYVAVRNRLNLIDAVKRGTAPQELLIGVVDAGAADLVGFVTRLYPTDLNVIATGTQAPLLVRAIARKHYGVALQLIAAGADVNAMHPTNKVTALMLAASICEVRMAERLLERGANVDVADYAGFTPLMFAAERGQVDCVKLLLARNADPRPQSTEGKTALDLARTHGNPEVIALLERASTCRSETCRAQSR